MRDKKQIKKHTKQPSKEYRPSQIEPHWQSVWEKEKVYQLDLDTASRPFYNLMMFPYPSAEGLHVGNVYTFGGIDAYGRFKRMHGYDVFQPFGLDGFGIHSENYAIKVGRTPQEHARISEKHFYDQMRMIGNGYDWSRKVETYKSNYYKWTQWLFIELFKAGLAYKDKANVNFCPSCKTVLSDEQVIDGKCERCGSVVEKRELEQWFFRITDYAERLLKNTEGLDWSEKVKIAQKQWIGKKTGMRIKHHVKDMGVNFETFTAYPAWSWADTFIVIAPEHPLVDKLVKGTRHENEVNVFIKESQQIDPEARQADKFEKKGVFTGRYAKDPFGGEDMPIWLANFALMDFGTGIIRCSAHDPRDYEFAQKYNIPLKEVVERTGEEPVNAHINKGVLIDSGPFSGRKVEDVLEEAQDWIEKENIGKRVVSYHLRDWLISRQRYWGPPIPMIYCESCAKAGRSWFTEFSETQTSPRPSPKRRGSNHWNVEGWYIEKELPVVLPDIKDFRPIGTGRAPLANHPEFYKTTCPGCGGEAVRETDVSDTFLDSSWYFFRYTSTDVDSSAFDIERVKKWLPVHSYIGGAEHAVLHLLYSRFITMTLHDLGHVGFEEPFKKFRANGLIIKDGSKMSKSKGNIINPDEYVRKFGADTLRTYLAFIGPFTQGGDFQDSGIEGINRFLKRVWKLVPLSLEGRGQGEGETMMHRTIKGVTEDIEELRFNTAIAKIMTYYNFLSDQKEVSKEEVEVLIKLLAPFAPHMMEELWHTLGNKGSIHISEWPVFDENKIVSDVVTIAVQVNGKLRDTLTCEHSEVSSQEAVEKLVKKSPNTKKHLEGKDIKKVIYVPGKIVNFVVH